MSDQQKMIDLGLQYGMGPKRLAERCRDMVGKELPPAEELRVCRKCQVPKRLDCFGEHEPTVCRQCESDRTAAIDARSQQRTLDSASNRGQPWTGKEEQFIEEHLSLTDEELAVDLGRTMFAVRKHREEMDARKKGRSPVVPVQIKRFGEVRSKLITRITIEPNQGDPFMVFCSETTTPEAIREEFVSKGYGLDLFGRWLAERVRM